MATLQSLLDAGGGVAIVSGEAGIGKSRLVREFAAIAEKAGRIVLWGRPEEVAQPGPYALIVDLLESIAESGNQKVRREVRDLIANLIGIPDGRSSGSMPTARAVAAETRGLISQLGLPALAVLEDLHWADEASHSVVLHLARASRDDGHVVVATLRPEYEARRVSLSRLVESLVRDRLVSELILSPLSTSDVVEMVRAMASLNPDEDDIDFVLQLGEGIPFFIEELVRRPREVEGHLPISISQVVRAGFDRLTPASRKVVTVASLLLGAIDMAVLVAAFDGETDLVRSSLMEAVELGLIADREGRITFRHALSREAIARDVISIEAARIHARIAQAIMYVYGDEWERHATALMYHYSKSAQREAATSAAIIAGNQALAAASLVEARNAFTFALQESRGTATSAISGVAEVEFRDGNEASAASLFEKAADSFFAQGDIQEGVQQLRRLAWALYGREDRDTVISVLDRALDGLAEQSESNAYAETLVQKGNMLAFFFRRYGEAKPLLEKGSDIARRLGSAALLAESLDGLANVAENSEAWGDAISVAEQAAIAARESEQPEMIGRTHNNLAIKLSCYGRPADALKTLSTGREYLLRGHGHAGVAALDVTQAWILRFMGRVDESASVLQANQATWHRWRMHRRAIEAWMATERNELDVARQVVESAWNEIGGRTPRASTEGASPERGLVLQMETLLLMSEGKTAEAVALAESLVANEEASGERFDIAFALSLCVRAFALDGNGEGAGMMFGVLSERLTTAPYPFLVASSLELQGLTRDGARDQMFLDAANAFDELGNLLDQARCLRQAAGALKAIDDRGKAIDLLRRARKLAEESGGRAELNRTEAEMRALGVRPRAGRPKGKRVEGGLSPREAEIVVLVASGASNIEIGQRLFVSDRTVQDHIGHALRKLGLPSRAALASWAAKQGMI